MNPTRILFTGLLSLALSAGAAELKGVTMPDTREADGTKLILNGLGARLATLLKVKVYVGGLYLEAPEKSPEAILASRGRKILAMHFLRDVKKSQIEENFREGLAKNCTGDCKAHVTALEKLLPFTEDMKKGDEMMFHMWNDSVEIHMKGQSKGRIESPGFPSALLGIWLGPKPPNAELKSGLLGSK